MSAYLAGLGLGFSLIMAIGAQNAFVLKQGLKQQHVFLVCLLCAASDALLITLGVSGFGILIKSTPWLETVTRYAGAAFLVWYGLRSLWSAWHTSHSLETNNPVQTSAWSIALTCLAFTWLNPHVYLDTVVLLGSVSTQFSANLKAFAFGAISASFLFFFSLGYGARLLIPLFSRPMTWKVLELLIGIMMLVLAWKVLGF